MKTLKIGRNSYIVVCLVAAFFYLWMAAQVPYTHDDWDWGLPVGIQQLVSANINSRYAGNLFVVVMTRSEAIKTLVMGLGYWLLPFLISEFAIREVSDSAKKNRTVCFLLCNVFLLTMNREIWQQTYGWVAGYANFVVSAIFMVSIIHKILSTFEGVETEQGSVKKAFLWGAIGFVSQLFLENIALFLFVLSVCAEIYFVYKNRCVSFPLLGLAVGTTMGLAVMFGSGIYQELWNSGSAVGGYRQVFLNSKMNFYTAVVRCFDQLSAILCRVWEINPIISSMILLLLSVSLLSTTEKSKYLLLALNTLVLAYFVFVCLFELRVRFAIKILSNLTYFLLVAAETIILFGKDKIFTGKLLVLWVCVPAVIAPLIITTEIGARLFLTPGILLVFFAAMLCVKVLENMPRAVFKAVQVCLLTAVVCLFAYYGRIYYDIGLCKSNREGIISQAVATGADFICLPQYPHIEYLWCPEPKSEQRLMFFKQFYGIGDSVTVEFVDENTAENITLQ